MATRKISIAVPEEHAEFLSEIAEDEGIPLSRLISGAAEREMRRRGARKVIDDWQSEHGGFTPDELASARAEMAAADAEIISTRRDSA